MSHLRNLSVPRYGGLDGLVLEDLRRVNLVTGVNGVGKTALLEAVWLFLARFEPERIWNQHLQRSRHPLVNPLETLSPAGIEIAGSDASGHSSCRFIFDSPVSATGGHSASDSCSADGRTDGVPVPVLGRLRVWLDDREATGVQKPIGVRAGVVLVPVIEVSASRRAAVIELPAPNFDLSDENITRFSRIVREGDKENVIQRLRVILPLVQNLEIVTSDDGRPYILATTDSGDRLPLQSLGGGMARLFRVCTAFPSVSGGILLLDEIEDGLHYSTLDRLWRDLRGMAEEFDAQVFATTHSMECLRAALRAFAGAEKDVAVHGLYRPGDETGTRAVTYADDLLEAAAEMNMDLR